MIPGLSDSNLVEPFPLDRFRTTRFRNGLRCPRCGHRHVHRWGRFQDRQRYRCLGCRRTFSDLTGTPLAYLKHLHLWAPFCRMTPTTPTLRTVSRALGIHVSTSFRWRHRLLAGLIASESLELRGGVSVDIGWLPHSEKGSRRLIRPPRRVRFEGFASETQPVWIAIACDDGKRALACSLGQGNPRAEAVAGAFGGRLRRDATLLARPYRIILFRRVAAALRLGLGEQPPGGSRSPRDVGPEPPRLWFVRFRRWLRPFRGVASRYLDHYLIWFRHIDPAPSGDPARGPDPPWLLGPMST